MILGIDEAGRGPVIGPLVLCGVWLTPGAERELLGLGVQDSKAFGSTDAARMRRANLAEQIRGRATHVVTLVAEAAEVDRRVVRGELNRLEQDLAQVIINYGPQAASIVADGKRLFTPLLRIYPHLDARDRADSTCVAVAAASIVAKVERDARFRAIVAPIEAELSCTINGGGYVNTGTETFLRAYVARFGRLPDEVRQTWSWSVLQELGVAPTAGLPLFASNDSRLK